MQLSPETFFEQQDEAKKWSLLFAVSFTLALAFGMLSIYVILCLLGHVAEVVRAFRVSDLIQSQGSPAFSLLKIHWGPLLITVALAVIFLIASLKKMKNIMDGGSTYAASMLGGQPLGRDLLLKGGARNREQRLKNIVSEMALASGVPEPDIYLLPLEQGINAMATGLDVDDAAIVLTWGALKNLSRDEMSGLIAHEFSHILNGDMRHNTIMAGWLYGLFFLNLLGRSFLSAWGGGFTRLSLLYIFGAIGVMSVGSVFSFSGRLLQAAFSRQREYLADASAVQFTRDAQGLAGVLKKIGGLTFGSRINAEQMPDYRHFFIARPDRYVFFFQSFFSTHPPLDERIYALDPNWDGEYYDFQKYPISIERDI